MNSVHPPPKAVYWIMTRPNCSPAAPVWATRRLNRILIMMLVMALAGLSTACVSSRVGSDPLLPKNPHSLEPTLMEASRMPVVRSEGVVRVQNTLAALERFDQTGRKRELQQVYFELPESDFNEYLAYSLHTVPRPGVEAAGIKLHAQNHVSVNVLVNFDRIADWAPIIPSLFHLSGKQVMGLNFVFAVQDAAVTFQVAEPAGKEPMMGRALQTLLHLLALHQPERYDTSKPIPLPYGLRRLSTTNGMLVGST